MTAPRSYVATAPLDQLARALMDKGYQLAPRDDIHHEFARLEKTDNQIVVYRCGCIWCDSERAAALLFAMAGGKR